MSREIKVRVWSDQRKDWLGVGEPLNKYIWYSYDDNKVTMRIPSEYIGTIEQYTGLKDKNGKEIYEGDIVLDYHDGDDAFIVEWDKDTASFILTGTDNIASVSFDNFYSDKDLEVIGNIHENQELLGGEE